MAPSFASGAAGYRSQPVNPSASLIYPSVYNPSSSFIGGGDHTSTLYPPPSVVWPSVATGARLPDVSSPDAWIDDLNRHQYGPASGFRGYSRLPKLQLPMLTRDPLQWPRFIQAFGFQVDRTCNDDSERVAFLSSFLCEENREELGSMLLHPGSNQQCLLELCNRYGSPRVVAAACSRAFLQLTLFKDHDFKGLSTFASSLRSTVSTLFIGGFEDELKSQTTLQQVISKLPVLFKDKWADYSFAITDHLHDIVDLDNWIHRICRVFVRAGMDSSTPAASRNQQEQKGGEAVP